MYASLLFYTLLLLKLIRIHVTMEFSIISVKQISWKSQKSMKFMKFTAVEKSFLHYDSVFSGLHRLRKEP